MKRQKNFPKKPKQNSRNELNKMETSNVLDAELVVRMLNEFKGRVDELREYFNSIKKGHGNHVKEPFKKWYTK